MLIFVDAVNARKFRENSSPSAIGIEYFADYVANNAHELNSPSEHCLFFNASVGVALDMAVKLLPWTNGSALVAEDAIAQYSLVADLERIGYVVHTLNHDDVTTMVNRMHASVSKGFEPSYGGTISGEHGTDTFAPMEGVFVEDVVLDAPKTTTTTETGIAYDYVS